MIAKDHFGLIVAAVIDDRVVDTAKGCAGIKCRIFDIERFHQIDDDVGTVLRLFLFYFGHF